MNLRYPNINGLTEREQLLQVKSFLHQLVEQLNYALPNIGSVDGTAQPATTSSDGEQSNYDLRSYVIQELQRLENKLDQLSSQAAQEVAERISFTMDEDGNLYYEVEE